MRKGKMAGFVAVSLRDGEQITLKADVVWRLQLRVHPRVVDDVGDNADCIAGHGWAIKEISKGDVLCERTDALRHGQTRRNGMLCHRLKRLAGMVRQASRNSM